MKIKLFKTEEARKKIEQELSSSKAREVKDEAITQYKQQLIDQKKDFCAQLCKLHTQIQCYERDNEKLEKSKKDALAEREKMANELGRARSTIEFH